MSSFTVSTVWGAGGVARWSALWPALASTAATTAHSAITISAATQVGMASSSSRRYESNYETSRNLPARRPDVAPAGGLTTGAPTTRTGLDPREATGAPAPGTGLDPRDRTGEYGGTGSGLPTPGTGANLGS